MANPNSDLYFAIRNFDVDRIRAILDTKRFDVKKPYDATVPGEPYLPLNHIIGVLDTTRGTINPRLASGLQIIDLLIKAGADVNGFVGTYHVPLTRAVAIRPITGFEVTKKLLLAGADPNKKARDTNQTILQAALYFSPTTIGTILLLLAFGANPALPGGIYRETVIKDAQESLRAYNINFPRRVERARESGLAPPPDQTQEYTDVVTALTLPKERYAELKPIILRAVENRYLTEDQALFLLEKLDLHHARRRHALALLPRPSSASATAAGSGAGAASRRTRRRRRKTRRT